MSSRCPTAVSACTDAAGGMAWACARSAPQSHAQPILGDKRESHAHGGNLQGILAQQLLPLSVVFNIADGAAFRLLQTGDGFQQLLLAAAGDTGDAQNLSGIGGEGDIVQTDDAVNALYGQPFQ